MDPTLAALLGQSDYGRDDPINGAVSPTPPQHITPQAWQVLQNVGSQVPRYASAISQALGTVGLEKLKEFGQMAAYPAFHAYPPSFSDLEDPRTKGAIENANAIALRNIAPAGAFRPPKGVVSSGVGAAMANKPPWEPPKVEPIGIHAYHGSPHEFEAFDASKIGTGEGVQMYGHGLYLAGREGTAKEYRDTLSANRLKDKHGELIDAPKDENSIEGMALQHLKDAYDIHLQMGRDPKKMPWFEALDEARGAAEYGFRHPNTSEDVMQTLKDWRDQGATWAGKGHMYETNIKADPDHFLHWDKPINEQSPYVQQKLKENNLVNPETHGNLKGQQIYKHLGTRFWNESMGRPVLDPPGAVGAAQYLQQAGIPGIKYFDQGSRKPGTENPSHNYVAFNDKTIDVLRRYGMVGLIPAAGAAAAVTGLSQPDNARMLQHLKEGGI